MECERFERGDEKYLLMSCSTTYRSDAREAPIQGSNKLKVKISGDWSSRKDVANQSVSESHQQPHISNKVVERLLQRTAVVANTDLLQKRFTTRHH